MWFVYKASRLSLPSLHRISLLNYRHLTNKPSEKNESAAKLVYEGSLSRRLFQVKMFSLMNSALGLTFQPFILNKIWENSQNLILLSSVTLFANFFVIGTPLLLQFIGRRYVTELTFDSTSQTFEAVTLTLFNLKKKIVFKAGDVEVPEVPGPLTSFYIKKHPLMIDGDRFTDMEAYKHLMGYDNPIDFKLKK